MDRRRFLGLVPLVAASPVAVAASLAGKEVTPGPAKMVFTPDEVKSLNAFQLAGSASIYLLQEESG